MRVRELIEKLQEMDQEAVVVFFEEMDSSFEAYSHQTSSSTSTPSSYMQ